MCLQSKILCMLCILQLNVKRCLSDYMGNTQTTKKNNGTTMPICDSERTVQYKLAYFFGPLISTFKLKTSLEQWCLMMNFGNIFSVNPIRLMTTWGK